MKRIYIITALILLAVIFTGCKESPSSEPDNTYSIVCTAFPQYDWIKSMTSESQNISVTLIGAGSTDIHSYQATAKDILTIINCDLLIGIDRTSDKWAFDAAKNSAETKAVAITELAGIHGHQHSEQETCEPEHDHSVLSDEHIWLSPQKAVTIVKKLSEILKEALPEDTFLKSTCESYVSSLSELDQEYKTVLSNCSLNVLVVADRFPFAHLASDYNINCFAAFPGCSADTDASFETVIYLASKVDEYSLEYVVVTENSDMTTASAVIKNAESANIKTAVLDSFQSISKERQQDGTSYVSVMKTNLQTLKKILGYKGE